MTVDSDPYYKVEHTIYCKTPNGVAELTRPIQYWHFKATGVDLVMKTRGYHAFVRRATSAHATIEDRATLIKLRTAIKHPHYETAEYPGVLIPAGCLGSTWDCAMYDRRVFNGGEDWETIERADALHTDDIAFHAHNPQGIANEL
ncbi:hypothetical protein [Glycomyces arizonensis]|uniref:hypothetical protein n=1 Tax=Glycomyces arizonensis TaxID=256035 RepID=UPI0012ECBA9C|nr:hypothetical protein [Glycomyces arizonensis]